MHLVQRIPYWGFLGLLIYMPFHVFLSQWISLATGGLDVWKIGKDVLLFCLTVFTVCLVSKQRKDTKVFKLLLGLTTVYGALHLFLWAVNPDLYQQSAILSLIYNTRLPVLALLGLGAALLYTDKFVFSSVIKFILLASTTVSVLGIVQYFLPSDLLTHFGYSLERGVHASFLIDNNPSMPRIMSTLREPNSLGAYLVFPVSVLTALLFTKKNIRTRFIMSGILLIHLLALFLTYSRSAWLATIIVIGIITFWLHQEKFLQAFKRFWLLVIIVMFGLCLAIFPLRETAVFQTYIIHTDGSSEPSSTDHHYIYVQEATEAVLAQPTGYGPGTAGPTSLHNPAGANITENYYLQIAYEIGVIGLTIFVAINVLVYLYLWRRHDFFGIVLIASFWGYVAANMFLHAWGNEAVAAQWWLLAGAAIGIGAFKEEF